MNKYANNIKTAEQQSHYCMLLLLKFNQPHITIAKIMNKKQMKKNECQKVSGEKFNVKERIILYLKRTTKPLNNMNNRVEKTLNHLLY